MCFSDKRRDFQDTGSSSSKLKKERREKGKGDRFCEGRKIELQEAASSPPVVPTLLIGQHTGQGFRGIPLGPSTPSSRHLHNQPLPTALATPSPPQRFATRSDPLMSSPPQ